MAWTAHLPSTGALSTSSTTRSSSRSDSVCVVVADDSTPASFVKPDVIRTWWRPPPDSPRYSPVIRQTLFWGDEDFIGSPCPIPTEHRSGPVQIVLAIGSPLTSFSSPHTLAR